MNRILEADRVMKVSIRFDSTASLVMISERQLSSVAFL